MQNKTFYRTLTLLFVGMIYLPIVFSQVPFNMAFKNELSTDNHHHKLSWKVLPDANICLLLVSGESPDFYLSYAKIDKNGKIILGPDKITRPHFSNPFITFDDKGILYIFDNPNHFGDILKQTYNPYTKQFDSHKFSPPYFGYINDAKYLEGIGNVIYAICLKSLSPECTPGKPFKLIVDNPNTKDFDIYEFDRIKGYPMPQAWISLHKISDSKILVLGNYFPGEQNLFCKFIYDLEKQQMVPSEPLSYDELIEAGAPVFWGNIQTKSQVFNFNDRIFCILPSTVSNDRRLCRTIIVELDKAGEVVLDSTKTPLKLVEGELKETPQNYILLQDPEPSKGLWVLSLDNFPTLILDKEE